MPRPMRWIDTIIGVNTPDGAADTESLMTSIGPVDTRGVTVIRTIVRLDLMSSTVAGAWGSQSVNLAIGIAGQEAFAAGIFPDPNANEEPARGWMWRDQIMVTQNGISTEITKRLTSDLRGSRKIQDGEVYLTLHNNNNLGTAFPVQTNGLVRLLVKLA